MRVIKIAAICAFMTLFMSSRSNARDWRGIIPLHSTCADVKRILNISSCDPPVFKLEDVTVNITFSDRPCADGWNVPPHTVISITIYPKEKPRLADLQINIEQYKRVVPPHQSDWSIYLNSEEGISIAVAPDGKIEYFTYGPTSGDTYLRYPNSLADRTGADENSDGVILLDEYKTDREERKSLKDFAFQLRSKPNTKGYIVAYAGRRAYISEAQSRAERAKNYLVNILGIENSRVITVDGGYREEFTVELFLSTKTGGTPILSPTICPSEVQIIKLSSIKNKSTYYPKQRARNR